MLSRVFFREIRRVLDRIEQTQGAALDKAAGLVVDCLAHGGTWHLMDTGHMLDREAVGRAGGMMAITPLRVSVQVDNPVRAARSVERPSVYMDQVEGLAEFVAARSGMVAGDVLTVGSVSGHNALPVGLALEARSRGLKVIAITSVTYSGSLVSQHRSGLRLFEVADVVLDHGAPVGDALVEVPDLPVRICPASGIAAAYLFWALHAEVVGQLLKRGLSPHVYMSNHLPGAHEFNRRAKEEFARLGY